jgi:hypothetical protein
MKNPTDSPETPRNLLPGMAGIALWMLGLAIVGVIGVLTGHYPAIGAKVFILTLSTFFAISGLGLIRRRRWGWALTLGGIVLAMTFALYSFMHQRQSQWFVMSVANFIFFLYLIRPEVVQSLK